LTYGYCFSVISNTLGQPNFYTYLGLTTDPTSPHYSYTNSITGAATGLFSVGGFFGAIFLSWLTDAYGRKKALIVADIATIIGGALSTGTAHIAMFLIGRLLTGFATGSCARSACS
jgi:MFS family permease